MQNYLNSYLLSVIASIVVHFSFGSWLGYQGGHEKPRSTSANVAVKLLQKEPQLTKPPEVPLPTPAPTLPPPKTARKKPPTTKAKPPSTTTAKPVQGLNKKTLSDQGTGVSVPVGNSLMTADQGLRLDKVEALDLSQAPERISLHIPELTEDAIAAGIQGLFVIDVYIAVDGSVQDAELKKKVGHGMDELLLASAKSARFRPYLNKQGIPAPIWHQITFKLVLPD